MSEGRIIIGNSSYSNIKLQVEDEEFKDISVDLKKFHIFHNDIVNVVDGRITAISEEISKYRSELLPGILEITGIKKYGFTKRGTPIYLWRPFDKRVPCFYVSSNIRKDVSHRYSNVYCIIRYDSWDRDKPTGTQIRILGSVHDDRATSLYLQYCYGLYNKRYRFPKDLTIPKIDDFLGDIPYDDSYIFSIDPKGTLDIDDAFSIKCFDNIYEIGIYIADPTTIIDILQNKYGCDSLLKDIYKRGFTVYNLYENSPMMPTELSNGLVSLLPGHKRLSLSVHLRFKKNGIMLPEIGIKHNVIKNNRAYSYAEVDDIVKTDKTKRDVYKLYELSQLIAEKNTPVLYNTEWDSHKMVETMMVLANMRVAQLLYNISTDKLITRSHKGFNNRISSISDTISQKIRILNTQAAKYTTSHSKHVGLGVNLYTHYTSPIRRIVDLYTHYLIKEVIFDIKIPKEIEGLPDDLDRVNQMVKMSKRYELTMDKLKIYNFIREEFDGIDTVEGVIVGMRDNYLRIFIEKYNIVLEHHIIHPDISHLYIYTLCYDNLGNIYRQQVESDDSLEKIQVYELYKSYKITLYTIKADRIRDRIRFDFED